MIKIEYRQSLDFNNPKVLTFTNLEQGKSLTLIDGQNLIEPEIYQVFENTDYLKSLIEAKYLIVEKPLEDIPTLIETKTKSKLPPIED